MASPFANLVLMAAYVIVTVPLAHDGLEELLAQAHAAVARHPEALNPRLQRAALYRQHEEWELATLDLQAAIKISGDDDPVVLLGQAELELAQGRAAEALPLLLQMLNMFLHLFSPIMSLLISLIHHFTTNLFIP